MTAWFRNYEFDEDGYDKDGYDREEYDRSEYNRDGYNRNGWNKETDHHRETGTQFDPELSSIRKVLTDTDEIRMTAIGMDLVG